MKTANYILSVCLLAVSLTIVGSAAALPISATETISDPQPFEPFNRNLSRTRSDSNGFFNFEDTDATIIAENLVDSDFGLLNLGDVSYRHIITWLNPPVDTFLFASLTVEAFGVLAGDDTLFADTIQVGNLANGTIGSLLFSTTVFSDSNPITLAGVLGDGFLDIFINKNNGAGFPANLNALSVFSSSLTVRYEPVPEPSTIALFGLGLAGVIAARRRKRA